jgi:hypothetical protein
MCVRLLGSARCSPPLPSRPVPSLCCFFTPAVCVGRLCQALLSYVARYGVASSAFEGVVHDPMLAVRHANAEQCERRFLWLVLQASLYGAVVRPPLWKPEAERPLQTPRTATATATAHGLPMPAIGNTPLSSIQSMCDQVSAQAFLPTVFSPSLQV